MHGETVARASCLHQAVKALDVVCFSDHHTLFLRQADVVARFLFHTRQQLVFVCLEIQ